MFEGVYGLKKVAEQEFDEAATKTLWGVEGRRSRTVLLETPGTLFGIRLIRFDPVSPIVIRDQSTGFDCDALKVIDFYAPDIAAAEAAIKRAGFKLKDEVATYELAGGKFFEGHLWGPDQVVTALIGGPKSFMSDFVSVTDRAFSEVMSVSSPVEDPAKVLAFYDQVLGLWVIHEYVIDDASFGKLVGTSHKMSLRAKNVGLSRSQPYFGIIHYGLPKGAYRSLKDRSVFPNRGIVAGTLFVTDVVKHAEAARAFGCDIVAPLASVTLKPYGRVQTVAIRGPHGVIHQLIEP